jgi:hypothetical protein
MHGKGKVSEEGGGGGGGGGGEEEEEEEEEEERDGAEKGRGTPKYIPFSASPREKRCIREARLALLAGSLRETAESLKEDLWR